MEEKIKSIMSQMHTMFHDAVGPRSRPDYMKERGVSGRDWHFRLSADDIIKDKIKQKFQEMYSSKVEGLYKGIIKNYSVKLADIESNKNGSQVALYRNIFTTLEDYIRNVLPLKLELDENNENYNKIIKDYHEFEKFTVGKLDEKEFLDNVDMLADRTFEDQCTNANPRLPLVSELKQIMLDAYYGKEI